MIRTVAFHPRLLITLVVSILALVGGFVLAQMPPVRAAMTLVTASSIPATFNYQGLLRNADGSLMNGTYNITAKIYDAASGGNELYTELFSNVVVRDGLFNIVLGDNGQIVDKFNATPRYIGITLNTGSELIPRERMHAVPWALYATNADAALNATNATNATTAGSATYLTGVTMNTYTSNNTGSTPLTQWQEHPESTLCALTSVQQANIIVSPLESCTINSRDKTLAAGINSICEAVCITWNQ